MRELYEGMSIKKSDIFEYLMLIVTAGFLVLLIHTLTLRPVMVEVQSMFQIIRESSSW